MRHFILILIIASLLLSAAIFGFFYAWVCSTIWGLDSTDPRVAITAMQAMNASVRNVVFFPAFFVTPALLFLTAFALWRNRHAAAARWFAASAAIYLGLGLLLTLFVNVPMNEALAAITPPTDIETAAAIWVEYSPRWQFWNQIRTVASGLSFLIALIGAMHFPYFHIAGTTEVEKAAN